ncbi:hypothetical protein ACK8P5_03425 [Paenibacillus sp. EC2-1]|uniref:hypothetical protein n=1 Tax=Paenibacillus sp. EC2-1 TaxID=3388665 RepID=UPI003BEF2BDF
MTHPFLFTGECGQIEWGENQRKPRFTGHFILLQTRYGDVIIIRYDCGTLGASE